MRTPLQQALAIAHKAGFTEAEFYRRADIAFATGGVLYVGPDALLIADNEGDEWFVFCAVGEPARLFALAPERKKYVAWVRDHRGRPATIRVTWDRAMQLLSLHGQQKESSRRLVCSPAGDRPVGSVAGC